ncbi:hypothetical protein [Streptomyces sp. NPDC048106]|uniref:hypothetical protein n=1 Tax=Streptomyces sp. NPDC048106 TaxID=3155750 RepID=UPI003452559C
MERGPTIFVGVVFALFGGALPGWNGTRLRRGAAVALGVNRVASATLASLAEALAPALGGCCLTRL